MSTVGELAGVARFWSIAPLRLVWTMEHLRISLMLAD